MFIEWLVEIKKNPSVILKTRENMGETVYFHLKDLVEKGE